MGKLQGEAMERKLWVARPSREREERVWPEKEEKKKERELQISLIFEAQKRISKKLRGKCIISKNVIS